MKIMKIKTKTLLINYIYCCIHALYKVTTKHLQRYNTLFVRLPAI